MLNSGVSLQRLATKAGVGFTPKKLFSNGEAGVWYDPSDVEASLTWRRNLLEYTESFDNNYWAKQNLNINSNQTVAPDGTTTADKIAEIATNTTYHFVLRGTTLSAGIYTLSAHFKASERNYAALTIRANGSADRIAVLFDLVNGTVSDTETFGSPSNTSYSITSVGNGWYKCSVTVSHTSGSLTSCFSPHNDGNGDGIINLDYAGTAGHGVFVWGAQLEEGSTATEYQPIRTTFDNAFKQAFPKHTLYQDHNGGTPVTGLGQAVGLMLDKSEGVALTEKFVDTEFDVPSEWVLESQLSITNGELDLASSATSGGAGAYTDGATVVGRMYRIEFEVAELSGTSIHAALCNSAGGSNQQAITPSVTTTGKHTFTITATGASTTGARLRFAKGSGLTAKVLNFSMKEVSGSHATQSDSTKRPVFARHPERGRVNLFKYTEEFDNGYWSKGPNTVVTANYGVAPNGTQTADRLELPASSGTYFIDYITFESGKTYTYSIYAKATSGTSNFDFYYDKGDGTNRQVGQQTATSEWQRFEYTITTVGTNGGFGINNAGDTYVSDILIWGAQLEEANEATGYQKVVDDYDITESGYKSVYYLQFDGVNDCMKVNNLTSSSTPLTALLGYSKQNMAATYSYLLDIETGRTVIGTGSTANRLQIYDTTNSWQGYATTGEIQVATIKMFANDASIRKNGIEEFTTSSYAIAPIGGQVSLFSEHSRIGAYSQGNLYQCVVRAATSTDKEIDQAEEFVAIKTGLKSEVVGLATLDLNFGANTYTARNSNGSVL
jgi:hypothetical protein